MLYGYFDWTYLLVIAGVIVSAIASAYMNSAYKKYSRVRAASGLTGREAAEIISNRYSLPIGIRQISGKLTDNFDPRNNTLSLSDAIYGQPSIAAVGVAAHECGHAIQHNTGYGPLAIRNAFVPVVNIGSKIAFPLIIIGLIMTGSYKASVRFGQPNVGYIIMMAGIICFSLALVFQLITLPVEFNASARGIAALTETGIIKTEEEKRAVKKVLTAAALTYVAAALATFLQIVRLLIIANSRKD